LGAVAANPAAILLEQLVDARGRGEDFAAAWPHACRVALAGVSDDESEAWLRAFAGTSGSWRASYERQPAPAHERALLALVDDGRVPLPDRPCAHCGGEIAKDAHHRVRYCSAACRSAANSEAGRLARAERAAA